jgi:hypothetical protein
VSNDSFAPIYEYIQQAQTPVDAMSAPPGWTAVPWNSDATPDVTAAPFEGLQPPNENDALPPMQLPPALTGVLYYTTTDPIMPGTDLDGFDFDSSQAFSGMAEDSTSIVSDAISAAIDADTTGVTSEAISPTLVPEPGTIGLLLASVGVLLLRACRKPRS